MSKLTEHIVPPEAPRPAPMQRAGFAVEWRVLLELGRLSLALPRLLFLPRGSAPVLLIPGWKAPEITMSPLRLYLRTLGYDARHWGLGTNRGHPERDSEKLAEIVTRIAKEKGQPVGLVGWSLGGVVGRETARLVPEHVCGVVTYGTPAVGGPTYTLGASTWGRSECERIAKRTEELDRDAPIAVPIAAIFTRTDEVVSWAACIDRVSPKVRHFEVESPHVAMGLDPAVWSLVARQLHSFTSNTGASKRRRIG